jgi:hypothetical protein
MLFYLFAFASALLLKVAVSSTIVIRTNMEHQPLIGVEILDLTKMEDLEKVTNRFSLECESEISALSDAVEGAFPGIARVVTDMETLNSVMQECYGVRMINVTDRNSDEKQSFSNILDWMSSIGKFSSDKIPITINSQETIIKDAVSSFKAIDSIPNTAPYHLFQQNLLVHFNKDPSCINSDLKRNYFFMEFSKKVLQTDRYFTRNAQGFLLITENQYLYDEDLDFYEAFGFFLAKAFQNNISPAFGLRLHPRIVKSIQTGKTDGIPKYMRTQIIMLTLGFVRACPAHILEKHPLLALSLVL